MVLEGLLDKKICPDELKHIEDPANIVDKYYNYFKYWSPSNTSSLQSVI